VFGHRARSKRPSSPPSPPVGGVSFFTFGIFFFQDPPLLSGFVVFLERVESFSEQSAKAPPPCRVGFPSQAACVSFFFSSSFSWLFPQTLHLFLQPLAAFEQISDTSSASSHFPVRCLLPIFLSPLIGVRSIVKRSDADLPSFRLIPVFFPRCPFFSFRNTPLFFVTVSGFIVFI